jgi:hypothetical protein
MKRIEHKLFLLAALAILAGACMSDNGQEATINPGERLVTLALSVPGTPASRGLGADENTIKSVDVLLFNKDNDRFYYRAVGTIDKVSNDKFTVRLPEDTWNVVVLANAREAGVPGTERESVTRRSPGLMVASCPSSDMQAPARIASAASRNSLCSICFIFQSIYTFIKTLQTTVLV